MFPSGPIIKRFIVIIAVSWVLLLVLMYQHLLKQHGETERSAAQILTGNMLKIRCGNEISELRDRFCIKRFKWVIMNWVKDKCFGEFGVSSKLDIDCSVYQYLVFVERICPIPHNAVELFAATIQPPEVVQEMLPTTDRVDNFTSLFKKLDECGKVCWWISNRVQRMNKNWLKTGGNLVTKKLKSLKPSMKQPSQAANSPLPKPNRRLCVLLHMGLLTKEYGLNFGEAALAGGPLGELVQWADLMSAVHVLGYDLVLSWSPERLVKVLLPNKEQGKTCKAARTVDLIFTDLNGLEQIRKVMGSLYHYRCLIRVLDVYGTDPEFNHPQFNPDKDKSRSWGGKGLNPAQFYTHFPHSPDNSFLGFVVEKYNGEENRKTDSTSALLYGKRSSLLGGRGKHKYLDKIHEYYEDMHATLWHKDDDESKSDIPPYVINHKILQQDEYLNLLRRSSVFVGLGWPLEGPAALEAIANGVVYLNPRFTPPRFVDTGKPTNRKVTSQNPYAEMIGKPYVYTLNIRDSSQISDVLKEIDQVGPPQPYVPYEFTFEGYLERIEAYIEKQDFCEEPVRKLVGSSHIWKDVKLEWPPLSSLHLKTSEPSESCSSACSRHQMVCERSYFAHINTATQFRTAGLSCVRHREIDPWKEYRAFQEIKGEYERFKTPCHAPSYTTSSQSCFTQLDLLLFSCACTPPSDVVRLCPCRKYKKEQIALTDE